MTHFSYSDPLVNAVQENDRSLLCVTIMRDLNPLCRQMQLLMPERVVNWLSSVGTTSINSFLLLFIISSSTSPFSSSSSFSPSSFFLFLILILLFLFSFSSSSSSFCPSSFFLFLILLFLFSFASFFSSFCSSSFFLFLFCSSFLSPLPSFSSSSYFPLFFLLFLILLPLFLLSLPFPLHPSVPLFFLLFLILLIRTTAVTAPFGRSPFETLVVVKLVQKFSASAARQGSLSRSQQPTPEACREPDINIAHSRMCFCKTGAITQRSAVIIRFAVEVTNHAQYNS